MQIYKITNLINNKIYIGQDEAVKERWRKRKEKKFLLEIKNKGE